MLHWCCMSGRIATILVLLNIIDNLWFTGVVCLVGLRLFLYCSLLLIIYASVVLYVWSDCNYYGTVNLVLLNIIDNLCLTGVVCLVGLRRFWYCYLWLIISAYLVLHIWSDYVNFCSVPYNWQFMLHWCCIVWSDYDYFCTDFYDRKFMSYWYCLVGLRLSLYCFLWLKFYASLVLHVWSDCDYLCTVSYDW